MIQLDVVPDAARRVITLKLTEQPDRLLTYIDLTPEMLEVTLAKLLAAWLVVEKRAGAPGAPGTWTSGPAIEHPEWKVGARPLADAVVLSFCPMVQGTQELWLTYAIQRQQGESMVRLLIAALAQLTPQGTA